MSISYVPPRTIEEIRSREAGKDFDQCRFGMSSQFTIEILTGISNV
jgi:hypothetical protein